MASEELSDEWIKKFEDFNDFYTDDVYFTNLNFIYVNQENEIEKVKEEKFLLSTPNVVTKEDLIQIIKSNVFMENKKYFLLTLLKVNIDLEPQDIQYFLKDKSIQNENFSQTFLKENNDMEEIVFKKTINMFQDLNDIFIILKEREKTETKVANSSYRFTRKNFKNKI
jgi:hypothetical protein